MSEPCQRSAPPGAILAGGDATRLGGAKATAELAGRPLILYAVAALAEAGVEPFVVAKAGSALPPLEAPVVTEPDEPVHPLAGVVAALRHAGSRGSVVIPCDAPFLSPMLLHVLAAAEKATAIRAAGRVHPLIARYPFSALGELESAMKDGASATQALEALDPEWIEASERETFNVNTPEDLARAEEILRRARA
ncbi:MAG: molybdenum cofactor guanylyltransferase [Actinomycetota bacterium]|nr:molybdenum cofactor guanylyltransferase [Actinomycetota bacterium]